LKASGGHPVSKRRSSSSTVCYGKKVEEAFVHPELKRLKARGRRILLSRSDVGRYVLVVYEWEDGVVTIIRARDMSGSERRRFRRK
jgi:uncharacterized DUF497 family protein